MAIDGPGSGNDNINGAPVSGQDQKTYLVTFGKEAVDPSDQTQLILDEIKKLRHEIKELKVHYETPNNLGGTGIVGGETAKVIFEGGGHTYTTKKDECGK